VRWYEVCNLKTQIEDINMKPRITVPAKRFEFTPGEIAFTRTRSAHSLATALNSAAFAMELWC